MTYSNSVHFKPIDNPNHISILLPTRNRPASLKNVFDSLEVTTFDKTAIDVWLYIDNDDEMTQEFIRSDLHPNYSFKINWVVGERTKTQGEMVNILWERSTTNAGIYFPAVDDCVFMTMEWDQIVRAVFHQYPDRIVLAYPDEATAQPGQVTLVILSAEWINITGRILTPYFPFWFDDFWLDQVAQMIQRKAPVNIQTNPVGNKGKTIRMRNLRFWGRFFNNTLEERITEAVLLRQTIYPEGSDEYWQSLKEGEKLAQRLELEAARSSDEQAIYAERMFAGESAQAKPTEKYLSVETEAVNHLFCKAKGLFDQGNFEKALAMLNNIQYASLKFQNLDYARALCLKSLRRHDEARQAELAELAINGHPQIIGQDWPETLQLVRAGENSAIINPQLSPLGELRIRLMPITLRLQVIREVLASKPSREWGSTFKELWSRYRRRRLA